ncbi:regulator of chromosome condensation, RCC1 [Bifidobacterium actinocoloniiforme DSM 22766]|uniref:Regulator of chromosome condensation, RCC1 n=1 Tax=Bifidobacterium actinocoloniiforme DSM 22766 TaxID=1437605 RepID=A0A086Z1R9_9BIFI|nr:regulator of chromosome condensation, RCC1 [Bifidobacterium actinocoloniiforme DSM 22766]
MDSNGDVWAWGAGNLGQLGNGSTNASNNLPVRVRVPNGVKFTSISVGLWHNLAIGTDGHTYAWGYNVYGQLGNDSFDNALEPQKVKTPGNVKFVSVSAGGTSSLAIGDDGNAYAWGFNNSGQLGDGTITNRNTPTPVNTSAKFASISMGGRHALAIGTDGKMYAWGDNSYGELGNGTPGTSQRTPIAIENAPKFNTVKAGGTDRWGGSSYDFSLGIGKDGTTYAWGYNGAGQLGIGSTDDKSVPTPVNPPLKFSAMSPGAYHALALTNDGDAYGWGQNSSIIPTFESAGNIGDGSRVDRHSPVAVQKPDNVSPDFKFVSISAGWSSSAAIGNDGNAYAWGTNTSGQLGDGTNTLRLQPVRVAKPKIAVTSVSFDGINAGTITHDPATDLFHVNAPQHTSPGKIQVRVEWTVNGQAQTAAVLDYEYMASYSVSFDMAGAPVTPPAQQHVMDGQKASWPTDDLKWDGHWFGGWELNGNAYDFTQPVTNNITLKARWDSYTFTISPVKGPSTGGAHVTVTPPAFDATLTQVSAGWYHSLGLGRDGKVYAWGRNDAGQLGDGTTSNRTSPVAVHMPGGMKFTQVVAGPNDSFALAANGFLYAWGWNSKGQLGNGNTVDQSTPVIVPVPEGSTKYTKIIPGREHTFAVTDTGVLYAWGGNDQGQLGIGTVYNSPTPVKVELPSGVTGFTQISAGNAHTVAISSTGQAYSWGSNGYGQLGSTAVTVGGRSLLPVAVTAPSGVSGFKQVVASNDWSLGISSSGRIYTWGCNSANQLGNGNGANQSAPVAPTLPTGLSFDQVNVVGDSAVALANSGAAWAWGDNQYGQLGNGNQSNQSRPVSINPPSGVTYAKVTVGKQHSLAIDTTGKAWAWGDNQYGQLGNSAGGSAGNLSLTAVVMTQPKLVITKVQFDGTAGTALTANSNGTWGVDTPAHVEGPVTVTISWSLASAPQTDYKINSYTYFTAFTLPKAGTAPLQLLTGKTLLLVSALAAGCCGGYQNARRKQSRRKPEHSSKNGVARIG